MINAAAIIESLRDYDFAHTQAIRINAVIESEMAWFDTRDWRRVVRASSHVLLRNIL